MPAIKTTEFVPFSARQMFDLVNDIESYPEFLPWCSDARLERHIEHGLIATLTLSKGPLRYSFTTENTTRDFDRIEMRLIEGPFKLFNGIWRFVDAPDGCRVSLDLEFEFSNRLLAAALSTVFTRVAGSMVNSFRQQAARLYG